MSATQLRRRPARAAATLVRPVRIAGRPLRRLRSPGPDDRAHLVDHLEELRWRLVIVCAWAAVAFVAAWLSRDHLFALLQRPLGGAFRIQTLAVTEPFFTTLTVAAHAALLATFPLLVYHGYRFIAPALTGPQRRSVRWLAAGAPLLFYAGVAFCYFLVLGPAVQFLLGFGTDSFDVAVRAREYYGFVSTMVLAMGVVFLFPLVLLGAGRLGLVRAAHLRANRRAAFVLVAIVAALLPTADVVSLAIETAALLGLFELSIWLLAAQERAEGRRRGQTSA